MTLYEIAPERATLHGQFSRDLPPVLTIESGDTVRYRTLEAGWNLEPRTSRIPSERPRKFAPRLPDRDAGHALCGPIAIRGAEPGMTLAVHIGEIIPGTRGSTSAGGVPTPLNERLGVADLSERMSLWEIDVADGVARNQDGFLVPLGPFHGRHGDAA